MTDARVRNVIPGETLVLDVTVTDPDTAEPINMAGVPMTLTIKADVEDLDSEAVVQLVHDPPDSPSSAFTIGGVDNNVVTIAVPEEETAELSAPALYWLDVKVLAPARTYYPVVGSLRTRNGASDP